MKKLTYSELVQLSTFEERFEYLKIFSSIGYETFGNQRYLNQYFYNTPEWKRFRRDVIIRDNACDLACVGYDIHDKIIIHHMNPITPDDVIQRSSDIFDMDQVICVSQTTHNLIHYGTMSDIPRFVERLPGDTRLW